MSTSLLSAEQIAEYNRDGFIRVRELFDREEMDLLRAAAKSDHVLEEHSMTRDDGAGAPVKMSLWNHPGDDIYGMFARGHRVVDRVETLLSDEAYHYHSKMIMKDAETGGAWAWHQDYGYWYQNGVLKPDLCSVFISVDAATQENGCLQVLKGSHRYGRIDHVLTGEQAGADLERVEEAKKRLELVHCELGVGDALFFHSNLLHCSAPNRSTAPRWTLICCYNARSNDPYRESHHPRYTPLNKVPDSAIKEVGSKTFSESANVDWLEIDSDTSTTSLKD